MLASIPLFSCLPEDQLEQIANRVLYQDIAKGETIFQEGDPGKGFYIVVTGKIKVFKLSVEGKEQILHIYGKGHSFGEVPVFQGKNFPASAMALEDSTILLIPRQAMVELISKSPALAMNMLADLSRRLREFTTQIENLSLKEVPARLAAYILTLANETAKDPALPSKKVILPISKAQLANLIGTTPETVSRMLKKMGDAGLIEVQTKEISILNFEKLYELSDAGRL